MAMNNFDVIYIDDEPSMTDIFTHFVNFKYKHWRVAAYNDSQELYNRIVSNEISSVVWIVDIMMPRKNGAQIAEAIARECSPGTVILGYTALDPTAIETQPEYQRGARHFTKIVNKQENFVNLLDLVDVWVGQ